MSDHALLAGVKLQRIFHSANSKKEDTSVSSFLLMELTDYLSMNFCPFCITMPL